MFGCRDDNTHQRRKHQDLKDFPKRFCQFSEIRLVYRLSWKLHTDHLPSIRGRLHTQTGTQSRYKRYPSSNMMRDYLFTFCSALSACGAAGTESVWVGWYWSKHGKGLEKTELIPWLWLGFFFSGSFAVRAGLLSSFHLSDLLSSLQKNAGGINETFWLMKVVVIWVQRNEEDLSAKSPSTGKNENMDVLKVSWWGVLTFIWKKVKLLLFLI